MVRFMITPPQGAGFGDFSSKQDTMDHMLSQISVDDSLQDFVRYRFGRYKLFGENQRKSADCNSSYGVPLPNLISGIFRRANRTKAEEHEDKKTKWIGFHRVISDKSKQQNSLQGYSEYSARLQKILAGPRGGADSAGTANLDEETNFKWIDPVDVLAHKTMKQVSVVSKASKTLKSFNAVLNLYKSFVRPMVELSLPGTSPYKMTDLAHNAGNAQTQILKSISDVGVTESNESTEDGFKLATEFLALYKMMNGLANYPMTMKKINADLRPLVFHNHLFSHRNRGTKYPEEGLALFILLKSTPHQFTSFQKYCSSKATDAPLLDNN